METEKRNREQRAISECMMHAWGFQLIAFIGLIFSKSNATFRGSQFQIQLLDHFAFQITYRYSTMTGLLKSHSPSSTRHLKERFNLVFVAPALRAQLNVISFPAFTLVAPDFNRKRRNSSASNWHHAILLLLSRTCASLLDV
jgi:hypothetical protein